MLTRGDLSKNEIRQFKAIRKHSEWHTYRDANVHNHVGADQTVSMIVCLRALGLDGILDGSCD